jgi:hypothetical protein
MTLSVAVPVLVAGLALRHTYPALTHRFIHEDMSMRLKDVLRAAALLTAAHSAGANADGSGSSSPATAADAGPVPPTAVGINLGGVSHFSSQRAFANLAIGANWVEAGLTPRYIDLAPNDLTADGGIADLRPGATAILGFATPDTGPKGVTIGCTWTGQGSVTVSRNAVDVVSKSNSLHFHWTNTWRPEPGIDLRVSAVNPRDPIRHIDCRETTTPATALFDPGFVKSLQGFKTIRFMDWQRTNDNVKVTWATRNQPSSILYDAMDGVPVEHMMALTNELGADPWFCMSWNADDDYIEHFARYVHDHLPAGRRVYIETSNEVWNTAFPAAKQAIAEGVAEKLSTNPGLANLYRYAEKTTEVMKIWTRVFADRPHSLVRIAASQQNVPFKSETVLGYRDTAAHVDALATSAYFGEIMHEGVTDNLDEAYRRLYLRVDDTIRQSIENKAVAHKFGKSYAIYEGGQAVVIPYNMPFLTQIEQDQRMYGVYRKFLTEWRARVGGALTLFNNVGDIRQSGAWGLLEHSGQPLSEAPKMRAVIDDRAK